MKRVLYIGTPIFSYHQKIIAEFERQGFVVDYYDDRPSDSSWVKGLIKIKRDMMNSMIQRYFRKIMAETQNKVYDLVFIVNCKVFSPNMIQQLRQSQKLACFVLYMWDSFSLYPESLNLISLFDKVYSFDLDDCRKISGVTFLPLFYSLPHEQLGREAKTSDILYDIASVCTCHPNRYQLMRELFPVLEKRGLRIFSYMFLNRMQYWYNKVYVKEFKEAKSSEFKFVPLSEGQNLEVLRCSNAVFDMQHNQQSGLTMRTIETLGAKKKLITANRNIQQYDFYNKQNVFILTDHNWEEIDQFVRSEYVEIDEKIYSKYSLRSWLSTIINLDQNEYLSQASTT